MMTTPAILPIANEPSTGELRRHLLDALHSIRPEDVRIATAYLTPNGFMELQSGMEQASRVRLLLGERPFLTRRGPKDTMGQPDERDWLIGPAESVDWHTFLEGGFPWLLLNHDERRELLSRGFDPMTTAFNLSAWQSVEALTRFLARDGVEIRRFLSSAVDTVPEGEVLDYQSPRNRLHAKAYLFSGKNGAYSAVGSSNLTKSGLSQNSELNLASYDRELTAILEGWFDGRWELAQDCKAEFIRRIEDCVLFGPRYTPWQVMLKSLHAAYGRFLELGLSEEIIGRLAGFQQQAVQRCVSLLKRHWGAMLCDSVGLGKTYEGLGILREYANMRSSDAVAASSTRALIICPAQLQNNWNTARLQEWGIFAETVTMESLPQFAGLPEQPQDPNDLTENLTRGKLRYYRDNFDIILVDESHNFRNPTTKRYQALMEIIRGGKPDTRVLLLTATPVNNSVWDLYHQLALITRGDDTWYAGRGPVPNLKTAFQSIDSGNAGTALLDIMMLSLVRRTRHDIRALQEAGEELEVAGQPIRFPEHEIPEPVQYNLQGIYGDIYRDLILAIESLNFAVYRLDEYGVDTGETGRSPSQRQRQQRNANFIGIMRTILLKRMESSLTALTATVKGLVNYLNLFLDQLDLGFALTTKQARQLQAALGDSLSDQEQDPEEISSDSPAALADKLAAPTDQQQRDALYTDVAADRDRLVGLLTNLEWLEQMLAEQGDPKAQAVRSLLENLPTQDANGQPTKVALFTTYKDTAEHLFRQFGGDPQEMQGNNFRVASNLPDQRPMSLLTGGFNQNRRRTVLEHFAPLATYRETEPLDDPSLVEKLTPLRAQGIDLLIATDVLSEGQNLQDAQYLINYDLPWNPVRIIQRAGRIDRLFSPHDKVFIYNVMPEDGLENLLNLVKNLSAKIETIEETVALDASVLGEQIQSTQLDNVMKLRAGGAEAESVYREGERSQGLDEGSELLNRYLELMREFATEDIKDIPDGVYSIKEGPTTGVYIMLKMPEESSGEVFWRFYPEGKVGQPTTSPHDVLPIIEAGRYEERCQLPLGENPFTYLEEPLQAAVSQVGQAYLSAVASISPAPLTTKIRRLLHRDDLLSADADLWDFFNQWTSIELPFNATGRPTMQDPVRIVNRLNPTRSGLEEVTRALNMLKDAILAEGLDRPLMRPDTKQPSVEDLELVAWELVVAPK